MVVVVGGGDGCGGYYWQCTIISSVVGGVVVVVVVGDCGCFWLLQLIEVDVGGGGGNQSCSCYIITLRYYSPSGDRGSIPGRAMTVALQNARKQVCECFTEICQTLQPFAAMMASPHE